jgi:tRNA nucleotidyltransferase/poly(A) polymerase
MREDRLRALRAIRFAGRFGFEIEPRTWDAIVESAPYLGRLSGERVQQELEKTMLQAPSPARAMRWWRESGAFDALVPVLATVPDENLDATGCVALPGSAARPERRDARLLARLAVLFAGLELQDAERTLKALKFSNAQVRWVAALSDLWRTHGARLGAAAANADATELRRLAAAAGRTRVAPLLRVASALWAARRAAGHVAPSAAEARGLYRRALAVAYRDPIALSDLALDGDDLRRAGIPAGPALGTILHRLLELVVEDPSSNTPERLLAHARALVAPPADPTVPVP